MVRYWKQVGTNPMLFKTTDVRTRKAAEDRGGSMLGSGIRPAVLEAGVSLCLWASIIIRLIPKAD